MDIDPQLLRQLLDTFKVELDDQLQTITDGLLRLEKGPADADRQELLNGIFRAAHNIKGASRGVGVSKVAEIAHHLEDLFSAFKQANNTPAPTVIDLCLETLDQIRAAMAAHSDGRSLDVDLTALYARLHQAMAGDVPNVTDAPQPLPAQQKAPPASSAAADAADGKDMPAAVDDAPVAEMSDEPARGKSEGQEAIRVTTDKLDRVAALAEELQVAKISVEDQYAAMGRLHTEIEQLTRLWQRGVQLLRHNGAAAMPNDVRQWLTGGADALHRVQASSGQLHKTMRSSNSRIGFISSGLQGDVRMLRLVPAATLLRPLTRSVRDIARDLGKQVDLAISGDDIELDRAVLEGLRDPLMHLLRNAIDHGLETPDERAALGKPETGTIEIEVYSAGGQICLEIKDDGKGIDAEKIVAVAIKKRLVKAEDVEAMDERTRLNLIFRPGFSSKDIITDVSGRGVGLDVVAANLRELKGIVDLSTEVGTGTTFTLTVPLTLSTERGLMVRAGGQSFVIPSIAVERIVETERKDILDVTASQAILLDGRPLPLRDLAMTLELEQPVSLEADRLPVVIVSKGWQAVALLVDEVEGEREIVIKRLQPPLAAVRNVNGATLTGGGDIVMVLNAGDLVESALSRGALVQRDSIATSVEPIEAQRILVVDDSITTRTLERNILEARGYAVEVATDGKEAWKILEQRRFDLVVTDIEMPEMNGFELTERIKTSDRLTGLPVVIVSSLSKEAEKKRGIEVGADAYIVKGQFETAVLLDVVQQLI